MLQLILPQRASCVGRQLLVREVFVVWGDLTGAALCLAVDI